jgi:hypothetical protein
MIEQNAGLQSNRRIALAALIVGARDLSSRSKVQYTR